jgi:RNA polymerase sigma factor (sigma-70 family)
MNAIAISTLDRDPPGARNSTEREAGRGRAARAVQPQPQPPENARFDALHLRLEPVVRRVLWTMLGPDGELDDITNDVFVRILQGVSRAWPDDIERWAARVAINTVHNTLRKRRYRHFVSWDPQTDPDVLVWQCDYDSRHVARRVAQVFSHMPKSEQTLLERRWLGATIDDLAAERACSSRTVKRRVQRALHRFELCVRKDPEVSSWLEERSDDLPDDRT